MSSKEKQTEYSRRWREKNRKHFNAYQKEYKRKRRAELKEMKYEKLESEPK